MNRYFSKILACVAVFAIVTGPVAYLATRPPTGVVDSQFLVLPPLPPLPPQVRLAESAPLTVNGVEFTALAPATLKFGPPRERSTPTTIRLRVTNGTNHSIVFPCMDSGFNVVLNRDGVDTPPFGWNNDWPCEDPAPVLVRPGNTWTVDLKASTYQEIRAPQRRTLSIQPFCAWSTSPPIAPGKHELSLRYLTFDEPTAKRVQEKLGSYPLWCTNVRTKPVFVDFRD